jgi:hypothetical protein
LSPESSFTLIGAFLIVVAVPAVLYALREMLEARKTDSAKDTEKNTKSMEK